MSWATKIIGWITGNGAEVDADHNLLVNLPLDDTKAGKAIGFFEKDPGVHTGTPWNLSPEVAWDYRLRVGQDTWLQSVTFNYSAQDTARYKYLNSTMTVNWVNGYMNLNNGGATASGNAVCVQSYKTFPIIGTSPLYIEFSGMITQVPQNNNIIDLGGFFQGGTAPYAPTDGVYFRFNNSGQLIGVLNYNGAETLTAPWAPPAGWVNWINSNHKFTICLSEDGVEFWIDDELVFAPQELPAGLGQPCSSGALPWAIREANSGVVGAAQSFKVSDITISLADWHTSKPWAQQMSGAGAHCSNGQEGGTMGSTANYANSANPTAAVPTNTTAALGTGLGGQFWETDTLAVTTDGIIDSYQIPAGGPTVTPKCFYCTGVTIDSSVQAVLTGGGYVAHWSLAYGHTAVSLATAEAAGAKAPRRIPLGMQTVASAQAALTLLAKIDVDFVEAICVNPGEFIAVVKKKVGTAPTAGVIAHQIRLRGYWQ